MKLAVFILISVMLNIILFMTQYGIDQVALEVGLPGNIIATESSHIAGFNKGTNGTYLLDDDYNTALPEGNGEVVAEDSNIFTDTWNKIVSWIKGTWGYKYLIEPLTILPNFVKRLFGETYAPIGFVLGYAWQIATMFSLIIMLRGGEAN